MADKLKYPIGTMIRFKPSIFECDLVLKDTDKIGKIVGVAFGGNRVLIVLSGSTHESDQSTKECFVTWCTLWYMIEPIGQQQLEFDFMY